MMKPLAVTALVLPPPVAGWSFELKPAMMRPLYTCPGPGLSRVALQTGPAPCCQGAAPCAQPLSTEAVPPLKPKRT